MSECRHNNHNHFMIWVMIFWSFMFGACEVDKMKSDIRNLEYKVRQCKTN